MTTNTPPLPSTSFTILRLGRDLNQPGRSTLAPESKLNLVRPLGELTEVEEGRFLLELQVARKISAIQSHPTLSNRQAAMLELADQVFRIAPQELMQYDLMEEEERYFQGLLNHLARALIGQGIIEENGEFSYVLHAEAMSELAKGLTFAMKEFIPRLQRMGRRIPEMPEWGRDNNPDQRLSEFDFELVITRFRRDVEGLLAYLYIHADVRSMHAAEMEGVDLSREKGLEDDTFLEEVPDTIIDAHTAQLRKERRSGGIPPGIRSIFEETPAMEVGDDEFEEGFRSAKKKQAQLMARKATDNQHLKGYGEPQRLSKAHRFSELIDPERVVLQTGNDQVTSTPTQAGRAHGLHPRLEAMIQEGSTIEQATPVHLTLATPRLISYDSGASQYRYPPRTTQEGSIPVLADLTALVPASKASSQHSGQMNKGGNSGSGRGPPQGGTPGGPPVGGLPGGGFPGGGSPGGGPSGGGPPGGGGWGLPIGPPGRGIPNRRPGAGAGPPGPPGGPPGGGGGPPGGPPPPPPGPIGRPPSNVGPPILDRYGLVIDDRYRFAPEHFDRKLKPEVVGEWDGNTDNLPRWIRSVNRLSRRSDVMHRQLGEIAAGRLTKKAKEWFDSLPLRHQDEATINWTTLRTAIATFFMNRTWLECQKLRANRATFREQGHIYETLTDYFIRKTELLTLHAKPNV